MKKEKNLDTSALILTTARKAILEILHASEHPLSYEDLKSQLAMDKATFYRNIAKFEEEGLIDSFESSDKKRYFELRKSPHAHFICKVCQKIECMNLPCQIEMEAHTIENMIIKGKCPECQ